MEKEKDEAAAEEAQENAAKGAIERHTLYTCPLPPPPFSSAPACVRCHCARVCACDLASCVPSPPGDV